MKPILYKRPALTKEEAKVRANKLVDYLNRTVKGKWKPNVFKGYELDYIHSARLGTVTVVYRRHEQGFAAIVFDGAKKDAKEPAVWTHTVHYADPASAYQFAVAQSEHVTLKLLDVINKNRKSIGAPIYKVLGIYKSHGRK